LERKALENFARVDPNIDPNVLTREILNYRIRNGLNTADELLDFIEAF